MNKIFSEAFIELTQAEEGMFLFNLDFHRHIIQEAAGLAAETERTVIIHGPEDQLGTYNTARGLRSGLSITELHQGDAVIYLGELAKVHSEPKPDHLQVVIWFDDRPMIASQSEIVAPDSLVKVRQLQ